MRENVQRFGRFLSGMVMPNIAVFIAWGFITALFIPTGWMPNETLAQVVLDISGRSFLVYNCELKRDTIGSFSCEMVEEFLRAFAFQAGITLHVNVVYGTNDHHKVEAIFKALGRALKTAIRVSGDTLPSTKGKL